MRRILRNIAEDDPAASGDSSALADPSWSTISSRIARTADAGDSKLTYCIEPRRVASPKVRDPLLKLYLSWHDLNDRDLHVRLVGLVWIGANDVVEVYKVSTRLFGRKDQRSFGVRQECGFDFQTMNVEFGR
jgi:hypothetical protein